MPTPDTTHHPSDHLPVDDLPAENTTGRKREGQTLAEFAITLPIVLLLLFGIVEFGRLFQSWVTIQNAARSAARYAITGQYDENKYDIETILPCTIDVDTSALANDAGDPRSAYPVVNARGETYDVNQFHPLVDPPTPPADGAPPADWAAYEDALDDYEEAIAESEWFFSTWYGFADCRPSDETFQMRKDILRLPSIYDQARVGAAGLVLDRNITGSGSRAEVEQYLRTTWENPSRSMDERAWFNVVVCSSRQRLFDSPVTEIVDNPSDPNSGSPDATLRFYTALNDPRYPYGACVLAEQPSPGEESAFTLIDNAGIPWMDAGGDGDTVMVIVTYNHPLITPLGLQPFVRLQARRAAVNEAFRVTNAERALGPGQGGLPPRLTATPAPTSENPTDLPTVTPLPTDTAIPSITPTDPPEPFQCSDIDIAAPQYEGKTILVRITNGDLLRSTKLTRSIIRWNPSALWADYPGSMLNYQSLRAIYWNADTSVDPTTIGTEFISGYNYQVVNSDDATLGTFNNNGDIAVIFPNESQFVRINLRIPGSLPPSGLQTYVRPYDLYGTTLYFDNPDTDADCELTLPVPEPPPPPTATPIDYVAPPTDEPNCASDTMRVRWAGSGNDGFMDLGDVHLIIENNSNVVRPLRGFHIIWPDDKAPNLPLKRVTVGGDSANDPDTTELWRMNPGDLTSPTTGMVPADAGLGGYTPTSGGIWNSELPEGYSIAPGTSIDLYIDFSAPGRLNLLYGFEKADFNGDYDPDTNTYLDRTRFFINCENESWHDPDGEGTSGTGGTGGDNRDDGSLTLDEEATLPPTQISPSPTPAASITPPPTSTPFTPTATLIPTEVPDADIAVDKSIVGGTNGGNNITVDEGGTVTFTITITNNGPDTAANIVIRDNDVYNSVNSGVEDFDYQSHSIITNPGSISASYNKDNRRLSINTLGVGQSVTLTIVAVAPTEGDNQPNRVFLESSSTNDPVSSNNEDTVYVDVEDSGGGPGSVIE